MLSVFFSFYCWFFFSSSSLFIFHNTINNINDVKGEKETKEKQINWHSITFLFFRPQNYVCTQTCSSFFHFLLSCTWILYEIFYTRDYNETANDNIKLMTFLKGLKWQLVAATAHIYFYLFSFGKWLSQIRTFFKWHFYRAWCRLKKDFLVICTQFLTYIDRDSSREKEIRYFHQEISFSKHSPFAHDIVSKLPNKEKQVACKCGAI